MKTRYIVMSRSFEYDDNWYWPGGGGHPEQVFESQEEAEKEAEERTRRKIISMDAWDLWGHSERIRRSHSVEEVERTIPEERYKKFKQYLNFHYVVTVKS